MWTCATVAGSATTTTAERGLQEALLYVKVHNAKKPDGKIRGQLAEGEQQPTQTTGESAEGAPTGLLRKSRARVRATTHASPAAV
jgi:hypothetical protein